MSASVWAPGTSISANSSIQSESFVATATQALFDITLFTYVPDTGTLYVYVAGKLQRPGVDVQETSSSSFTLTTGAPEGAIVLVVAFTDVVVSALTFPNSSAHVQEWTATGGQTVFTLTSPYDPGGNTLAVYVNGLRLFPDDYAESSTTVFTLTAGATAGDQVLAITKEDLMITDPVNISSGTINGTVIGGTNPAAGTFTNLTVTGNTILGNASGDSLTITVGTITLGANYTETRNVGTYPAGNSAVLTHTVTAAADAGGTTAMYAGHNYNTSLTGANNAVSIGGVQSYVGINGSGSVGTAIGANSAIGITSTGNVTSAYPHYASVALSNTGSVTTASDYFAGAPSITSSGTIATLSGFNVANIGHANVTTAVGLTIADMTASTNMRGIRSMLSSGANKYNLYLDGTADNYIAGSLGIGALPASDRRLSVQYTAASTSVLEYGLYANVNATATSGALSKTAIIGQCSTATGWAGTGSMIGIYGVATHNIAGTHTDARSLYGVVSNTGPGTLTNAYMIIAGNAVNSGGGVITNAFGLYISDLTAATNNYGIRSLVSSAANRWNLYIDGTADNYIGGAVGIGFTSLAGHSLRIGRNTTGSTNGYVVSTDSTVLSDVTVAASSYTSTIRTQATAFTLAAAYHFRVIDGAVGAGSTITNDYGFFVPGTHILATTNYGVNLGDTSAITAGKTYYGIRSSVNIASGGGTTWGLYFDGTAANVLNGNSSFGQTAAPIAAVDTTSFATNVITNTGATYTVLTSDHTIIQTTAASTYTLPAAGSFTGRILHLVTQFAGTVISASSNVVPLAGGAAGTAILPAVAGSWAILQSNGTNWVIIAS